MDRPLGESQQPLGKGEISIASGAGEEYNLHLGKFSRYGLYEM